MDAKQTQAPAKVSHKGSITGFVLALLSLASSAIGHAIIMAKYQPKTTATDVATQVGTAVDKATTKGLSVVFGYPFLVVGIGLGLIAGIFVLLRLRKVRLAGLIFSAVAILLIVWSLNLSIDAFNAIKAHPAN